MKSRLFSCFTLLLALALTMLLTACFPPPHHHRRPASPPKHYRKAPPPRYRSELMKVESVVAAMQIQGMVLTLDEESLIDEHHFLTPNREGMLAELDGVGLMAHRILPRPLLPPIYHRPGPPPKKRFHHPPPPPPRHYKKPHHAPHPVPPPPPHHRGDIGNNHIV